MSCDARRSGRSPGSEAPKGRTRPGSLCSRPGPTRLRSVDRLYAMPRTGARLHRPARRKVISRTKLCAAADSANG